MTDQSRLTVEQCETQARRCRELGRQTMSPTHRAMLEHIAGTWERIGIDIQRHGDRSTDAGYDFKV